MSIVEYQPAAAWQAHIAAYWVRRMPAETGSAGRRVYADGCADVICNAGNSTAYYHPMARPDVVIPLQPGVLYLGGTMTAYGVVRSEPGVLFTGIRFRPGGFYALFRQTMEPAVDTVVEFPDEALRLAMQTEEGLAARLDHWFDRRPEPSPRLGRYDFSFLRGLVDGSGGQISVDDLAREAHVSNRTLERIFKENVGIPPKEFLRIVRFQEVFKRLRNADALEEESLLRVAYDLGYYDHAHLTNEFKKYAGILPSELSHFYKTGIAGGRYF
ncbi:MAG TPA: helix-turn-helix transcriptional regulator [Puia sp.]|nr:helix-turn-helix transcriptional regulator [Puia sp.]